LAAARDDAINQSHAEHSIRRPRIFGARNRVKNSLLIKSKSVQGREIIK